MLVDGFGDSRVMSESKGDTVSQRNFVFARPEEPRFKLTI